MRVLRIPARLLTGLLLVAALGLTGTPASAARPARPTADDGARVVAEQWLDSRMVDLTIDSPAMGAQQRVRLLVPTNYGTRQGVRWPVLYLLHGCCDSYVSWTRSTDVEQFTAGTDVLVVMPEGGQFGFYSNWWNGGAGGAPRWETFHLTELRQILERGYGAGSRRAVAGLSMGGFGAMYYAAHSHLFRAAASFSGVVHPLDNPAALPWLYPPALWGDPVAQYDIWAAHDPTVIANRLRGVDLFVASGNGQPGPFDPPASGTDSVEVLVDTMSHALTDRLSQLHIRYTADFYSAGHHTWAYWQQELHRSFPMLMRAIGACPAGQTR
jgi:S-formylglutathione hydrolase FrmB